MYILERIKEQAVERYRDITEQRLKTYKIQVSMKKKIIFGAVYSVGTLILLFFLITMYPPVIKVVIDYSVCEEGTCSFPFTLSKASRSNIHIYTKVNNLPQVHMAYKTASVESPEQDEEEEEQRPYRENGKWVYPGGIEKATFPEDEYIITSENGEVVFSKEIGDLDRDEKFSNWTSPSAFQNALYKSGELSSLPPGTYTFSVIKSEDHPEEKREAILLGNISPFGIVLSNTYLLFFLTSISLLLINTIAALKYV
ncbi:hypothetical protein NEFER03_0379 [Nematocida sp. LUAm3]|nr:hypothetical protein NEFER03_0379 [Nematocida sp. LUAm3]KAI5176005.1 hypothetical protein NEFER02_1851 [Nematocida sp. LUAm2]KAI5179102.1 hypothetical protein NEFER01_1969 [Nematocida sp. LUAm1]